jgi:hypothetical protein
MMGMSKMIGILKRNPGNITVTVGSQQKMVSQEWVEQLRSLLG